MICGEPWSNCTPSSSVNSILQYSIDMKIALVGYGKMGKLIEQLAPEYGLEVALKLDEFNNANFAGLTATNFAGIPVAIEFSVPSATVENVERMAALGVNV